MATTGKFVITCLCVFVFASESFGQDTYAGTDAERLSRRVKELREGFTKKAGEWTSKAKHAIEGAKAIERCLDELRKTPQSYAAQKAALEAMEHRAADLECLLTEVLDPQKSNPVDAITKITGVLDELIALCQSDAKEAEALAQNAKTESLKKRYLVVREAALRNSRSYEGDKAKYQTLKVTDKLQEFTGELEFVRFYREHVRKLMAHLDAITDQQTLLAEVESMSASLDQLAHALSDFSKVISGNYTDATADANKKA